MTLNVLSAGAAKALVERVADREGIELHAEFGTVGAMRERLDGGAACDIIVLTQPMIAALVADGVVDAASVTALGRVHTGVAVPSAAQSAHVDTTASFKKLLNAASSIYLPDPVRSTAGIHCMKVFTALGLVTSHSARFKSFVNGAIAMRALAESCETAAVGITQCSEIAYTEGVRLIGALPSEFALATVYSVAITTNAANLASAARLINALGAVRTSAIRIEAGFERVE